MTAAESTRDSKGSVVARMLRRIAIALCLCVSSTAWAHHSRANFALDKKIELYGAVSEFSFVNPHGWITLAVVNDRGITESWTLELNSLPFLRQRGWRQDSLRIGDRITVRANPDRDPNRRFLFTNVVVKADGTELSSSGPANASAIAKASPPPPLGPLSVSKDFTGIWRRGAAPIVDPDALAPSAGATRSAGPPADIFGPASLPVTKLGQSYIDKFNVNENPVYDCVPDTLPGTIFPPVPGYSFRISRKGSDKLYFDYEPVGGRREVRLGVKTHAAGLKPANMGHSVGWFEGNTLVIATNYFSPNQWGNGRGLPSSDKKEVIERYMLTNGGAALQIEYTLTDPVYLTRPVTRKGQLELDTKAEWQNAVCDRASARRHLQ